MIKNGQWLSLLGILGLFVFSCSEPASVDNNSADINYQAGTISRAATVNQWPLLQYGNKTTEVTSLQYLLNARGVPCAIDGSFGKETENAVKIFQANNSLTQDGIVHENTWVKLIITVSKGNTGNAVKALQFQLNKKHGYNLTVDGDFGPATQTAVIDFQGRCNITQDGVAGPVTWQYAVCGYSSGTATFTYDSIKKVIQNKGYAFFTGHLNLNLVGVRGASRTANQWDDYFFVIYQENNVNKIMSFGPFTTDPGTYYLQNPLKPEGCAIVAPGQHRGLWKIGIHNGSSSYEALTQVGAITVYRDNNLDNILNLSGATETSTGTGINLHHGFGSTYVDKYSAGCQVFKNQTDLTKLLDLCKKSLPYNGSTFSYTLLNISDF